MSVIDRLRRASTRFVLAPDGVIYKLRRVNSADLAAHTVVEFVGGLEVQKEIERVKKEQKAEMDAWKREHTAPEHKEEAKRRAAEQEAHNAQMANLAMARTMAKNPKLFEGWMKKTNAYCCAGVVGAGVPGEGAAGDPGIAAREDVEATEIEPLTLCMKQSEEDPDADRIWVGHLDTQTLQFLAEQVSELSGAPSVAPFRS